MDWSLAIAVQRRALLLVIAGLFERIVGETVPRHVHLGIAALLRPAEAAVRRLIYIAAERLPVDAGADVSDGRMPKLPLIDRRTDPAACTGKTVTGRGPGLWSLDGLDERPPDRPVKADPRPDDPIPSIYLMRRLRAVRHALETIPEQARRLRREQAAMERPLRVMRRGRPPGHRANGKRVIDTILAECQELALMAQTEVETERIEARLRIAE